MLRALQGKSVSLVGPLPVRCRHDLIYEFLLKRLPDERLRIPPEGMTVQAIHTKAPLHLTSRCTC